jgi:hypothetical protein
LDEPIEHIDEALTAISKSKERNSDFGYCIRFQVKSTSVDSGIFDFLLHFCIKRIRLAKAFAGIERGKHTTHSE